MQGAIALRLLEKIECPTDAKWQGRRCVVAVVVVVPRLLLLLLHPMMMMLSLTLIMSDGWIAWIAGSTW